MDQSEFQPRFGIIASTQKLADRFLYTGALPAEPDAPLALLYSIEVTRAWFPSSRLISSITAVLTERFSTIQRSSNPLKSFEATIKNINEELYSLAEQGETEWIGHLNALLTLVDTNEVHISQTGTSTAYLFRQRRISQVTETNEDEAEPHPLNTFSNIISGQLIEGDRIVLSNQDLFSLVSLDHIRTAVTDQSPYVAATQIARSVKRTKVTSVSSIIIAIEQPTTWKEAGEEPLVLNLEESLQGWHKKAWKKMQPTLKKAGEISKKAWHVTKTGLGKAQAKWQETYGPKTKEMLQKSSAAVSKHVSNLSETAQTKISRYHESRPDVAATGWLKPIYDFDEQLGKKLKPFRQKTKPVANFARTVDQAISKTAQKMRPFITGKNTRYVIIVLAIAFLFGSLVSIRNRHNEQRVAELRSKNDQLLSEVQEIAGKTDVAISLSQKVEAQKLIVDAQKKLAEITNETAEQKQQHDSLLAIVQEKGDKLTNTRRLSANASFDAPAETSFIVATDKGIFTFAKDSNTGRYIARDLAQSELSFTFESADDKPVSANYDREKDEVFVLTSTKKVLGVRLENDNVVITKRENPLGDFAEGSVITTFGENLYLLSNKDGLLWKYPPSGDNYAKGVNQVDPGRLSLQDVTGMTIDGYIYVVRANGTVDKLLRGELAPDFAVSDVPASNHTPDFTSIVTNENSELLYLFDRDNDKTHSSRVITLTKNGVYKNQIAFNEELTDVKSFTLDEAGKRFWILAGNKIFEYRF